MAVTDYFDTRAILQYDVVMIVKYCRQDICVVYIEHETHILQLEDQYLEHGDHISLARY